MEEFLKKMAKILDVETVAATDDLKSFQTWDSLTVLSIIAMLDADYGVNFKAADFNQVNTIGELWALVKTKKNK